MKPFLEALDDRVLVCDGAMGTMLYAKGVFINRCFESLNQSQPELVIEVHGEYLKAGADVITIHVEAVADPRPVLARIRELGAGAGLALNPDTPLSQITSALDLCDLVLAMSVNAGFGGQQFNPVALEKLRKLRELAPHALLEIDGGINEQTIAQSADAGAQLFVVGSAIFNHDDYAPIVKKLTALAKA